MAILKAVMLLSASLLACAFLLRHWLAVGSRRGSAIAVISALLVAMGSVLDVQAILASLPVDLELTSYLMNTRHGLAVRWRLVLALVLLLIALLPARRWQLYLAVPAWLLLLGTFSFTSHAAAMGGSFAMLTDWLHFVAAGSWIGIIVAVCLAPGVWLAGQTSRLRRAMSTISVTGLACLLLVAVSGTVSALFHVAEPVRFFGSPYSWALAAKLGLVLLTVIIAAVNRFVFLPRLENGESAGLRRNLIAESVLLVAVFAATGLLTTSSLPHGQAFPGLAENLLRLTDYLWR